MGLLGVQQLAGTQYKRAHQIVISNPLNGVPRVVYELETIFLVDNEIVHRATGHSAVSAEVIMDESIALLDPITDQPTGQSVPAGLIYQALYSHFVALFQAQQNQS